MTKQAVSSRPELRAADDAAIENAIAHADPMVLRGLVYQLTGDPEHRRQLRPPLQPACQRVGSVRRRRWGWPWARHNQWRRTLRWRSQRGAVTWQRMTVLQASSFAEAVSWLLALLADD